MVNGGEINDTNKDHHRPPHVVLTELRAEYEKELNRSLPLVLLPHATRQLNRISYLHFTIYYE